MEKIRLRNCFRSFVYVCLVTSLAKHNIHNIGSLTSHSIAATSLVYWWWVPTVSFPRWLCVTHVVYGMGAAVPKEFTKVIQEIHPKVTDEEPDGLGDIESESSKGIASWNNHDICSPQSYIYKWSHLYKLYHVHLCYGLKIQTLSVNAVHFVNERQSLDFSMIRNCSTHLAHSSFLITTRG